MPPDDEEDLVLPTGYSSESTKRPRQMPQAQEVQISPKAKRKETDDELDDLRRPLTPEKMPAKSCCTDPKSLAGLPDAEFLSMAVLMRAGPRAAQCIPLLRKRVADGKPVHGRRFSQEDVEAAIKLFHKENGPDVKIPPETASSSGTASGSTHPGLDAPSDLRQLCTHGGYIPPSAVNILLGEDVCAICLDPLRKQAQTIALCGHIFHRSCLNDSGSRFCPKCRRPVDAPDRDQIESLKAVIIACMHDAEDDIPVHLRCGIVDLSQKELLARCNARLEKRAQGEASLTIDDLSLLLTEMREEGHKNLLLDRDSVVLTL